MADERADEPDERGARIARGELIGGGLHGHEIPGTDAELTKSVSALKMLTLVINVAIVAYLLVAKRQFGRRGGGRPERAELAADTGWQPLERATPGYASHEAE